MPFALVVTAFPTLEVSFASVPSVFRGSAILRFCAVVLLPSGGEHIVMYGVRWVWAGGGGVGG